jgi:hypothetical protein
MAMVYITSMLYSTAKLLSTVFASLGLHYVCADPKYVTNRGFSSGAQEQVRFRLVGTVVPKKAKDHHGVAGWYINYCSAAVATAPL